MIVDVPEYLTDNLFIQEQVRVSFGKEYNRKRSTYVLIFCRIRKKDAAADPGNAFRTWTIS